MASQRRESWDRRQLLWTAADLVGAAAVKPGARADEKAPAHRPRATSGDAVGPRWEQRLPVTVGPRDAHLAGKNDKVIKGSLLTCPTCGSRDGRRDREAMQHLERGT
jgi:hypothetical protein